MKISDIVESQDKDPLSLGDVNQMFSDNPELVDYIRKAYNLPKVKTWGDAVDVGSANYYAALEKSREKQSKKKTSKQTPGKPADTKPKDQKPRYAQIGKAGSDAAKKATGFVGKSWERGARWSRALGIPSPKKSKD